MKIVVCVTDLNLHHTFESTYLSIWSNQHKNTYCLQSHDNKITIDEKIDLYTPLGLVVGAYGIRRVDNEEVTHPCGTTVIDMSKIKKNVVNEFVTSLIDTTLQHKKLGTIQFAIQWKPPVIPPTVPLDTDMTCRMHRAAEQNLTLIAPFSPCGFPPICSTLQRMHSPYYTTNTGMQLPSGAFLLNTGQHSGITSHRQRLEAVLTCVGWTQQKFIDAVAHFELHNANIVLNILSKTLTMHSVQCLKYVTDIQFEYNAVVDTDRWNCPRYKNNFVGDCEDCAKEIYVETQEWSRIKSDDPLVLAFQLVLQKFTPVVVQGCVEINNTRLNHIWAALVDANYFEKNMGGSVTKPVLPTLILEGTSMSSPFASLNQRCIRRKLKSIYKQEQIFNDIAHEDVYPHTFYKYVVACMTPKYKDSGVIDFTYVKNNRYGITFQEWVDGNYVMKPSVRHSLQTIRMMEHVVEYDKPILPLTYTTTLTPLAGTVYPDVHNVVFGYKLVDDRQHAKVVKAVQRLKKKGWSVSMNVIDHEVNKWVECTFENVQSGAAVLL